MVLSSSTLEKYAKETGFDACGVALAGALPREKERLLEWLGEGKHGGMSYMANNIEKRGDPRLLVEGARSVIVTLTNYYPCRRQAEGTPVFARYAYGKDYHFVLKERLHRLFALLKEEANRSVNGCVFVDSAPVFEHEWARRAGLGWIGKNTLLIHRKWGSFCFIGVIISNLEFDTYSSSFESRFCGNCNRCVEACPTGALTAYSLDARRCISYHTIENKGEIPDFVRQKMGLRVFGCDICQEVCPWNRKGIFNEVVEFQPGKEIMEWTKEQWLQLDEKTFETRFKDSPLARAGLNKLRDNLVDTSFYD